MGLHQIEWGVHVYRRMPDGTRVFLFRTTQEEDGELTDEADCRRWIAEHQAFIANHRAISDWTLDYTIVTRTIGNWKPHD